MYSNQLTRENCHEDVFALIKRYCYEVSPDWTRFGDIVIKLNNAIWDDRLNFKELDAIIESHIPQTDCMSPQGIPTPKQRKRKYTMHSGGANKKGYKAARKSNIPVSGSEDVQRNTANTSDDTGLTSTPLDLASNVFGTPSGRMEELLIATGPIGDPVAVPGIGAFDFIGDPAAMPGIGAFDFIGNGHAFDFIGDPAAVPAIGAFDFIGDPAAVPGIGQGPAFGSGRDPSAMFIHSFDYNHGEAVVSGRDHRVTDSSFS